jgi:uncharacterized protein (TIGR02145 family)
MSIIKALFAVSGAISICIAQSVNISGKVTGLFQDPIPGASVSLVKGGQSTTTEYDGSFTLTGTSIITGQDKHTNPHMQFVTPNSGLLYVNLNSKSVLDIVTYTLQARVVSTVQKTMDAGTHSIALPRGASGVYLYKVRSGSNDFLIRNHSIGGVSVGTTVSVQGSSSNVLAKRAKINTAINDVIAVTKGGYLNYRVEVTNSDTSGIEIKMIVAEGTVTDADGNVYQAVRIGNQIWTVENLRTTKYNDGSAIPNVTDSIAWSALNTPGYCYYRNWTRNYTYWTRDTGIVLFGAFYNWYAVDSKKLAPAGWHVPTESEWDALRLYLMYNGYNWDGTLAGNSKQAKSLCAQWDWDESTIAGRPGCVLANNNKSGFSALPCGYRDENGIFPYIGCNARWWCANASYGRLSCNDAAFYTFTGDKRCGFSVRLVKDN